MLNVIRPGGDYSNITSGATTQVKSGEGILKKIVINTGCTGTIKVIDNTSGSTANIATITNPSAGQNYEYFLDFLTGLRIITSATCDITVIYE